tara:strand:- start:161 stop:445 length:285 start_codon:yes stop_codon:yes gene_type:complete
MKLTKEYLKDLILEEIQIQQQAAPPQAPNKKNIQNLKMQLIDLSRNLTGIQQNEIEIVQLFIEMIDLAKRENINVAEFKRRLGLAKDTAEKIAK